MSNNAVYFDIATYFNDNAFGNLGVDLFGTTWGFNNSGEVDKQILITDNSTESGIIKELYEKVSFQVIARGAVNESPNIVYNRLREIHEFLITRENVEINGTCYLEFNIENSPTNIGQDKNSRFMCSANYYSFRNSIK
jgi:hypothetical protein